MPPSGIWLIFFCSYSRQNTTDLSARLQNPYVPLLFSSNFITDWIYSTTPRATRSNTRKDSLSAKARVAPPNALPPVAQPRPRPRPLTNLEKSLKHHPDAPKDALHYGQQRDWNRKVGTMIQQMLPVATAAAHEGYRRLSLTPTQCPIGISDGRLNVENQSGPQHNSRQEATPRATAAIAPAVKQSVSQCNSQQEATPRATAVIAPSVRSSMMELCNRPFAQHIVGLHGFSDKQVRQLLEHI